MRLVLLGTGTSQGVPMIGCRCNVCRSEDPRDRRYRSSLLVESDCRVLIDTTPDFRSQALAFNIDHLDAVVYTHAHNDHIMGFDDLRRFCEMTGRALPIHASATTLAHLKKVFPYAFPPTEFVATYVHADPHEINAPFAIGQIGFTALQVPHGNAITHGYILSENGLRKAAYIPDCAAIGEETAAVLRDIPVLIMDGLRDKPHPTHMHIEAAIEAGRRIRAGRLYLTHLTHHVSHASREKELPEDVFLAYDGLVLEL